MVKNLNDYTKIIAQALDEMKKTQGAAFSLEAVNLAELQRMAGISRAKLRRLKENQFETLPDKRCGRKAPKTKLTGYTYYIRSHRYLIPPKRHVVCLREIVEGGMLQNKANATRWIGDS